MRFLIISVLLLVAGCVAPVPAQMGEGDPRLNGLWQGTIPLPASEGGDLDLKIQLSNDKVEVWLLEEGKWMEAKPGRFHVDRHKSNAVIYATDSGGAWVESWSLVVTLRSADELLVVWSRVVNNLELPLSNERSKFSSQGKGILKRFSSSQAGKAKGLAR